MDEEKYKTYKETKQELPPDPVSENEDRISDDEEEMQPRRRIRHYKKHEVMLKECEEYVRMGKRLPKLHSRWIVNRYINEHMFTLHSIPDHNRMVDELQSLHRENHHLQKRIAELEDK